MSNQFQNQNDKINIFDIPIDRVSFFDALKKVEKLILSGTSHQVATVNPEFIIHAQKDKEFKEALIYSSLNTADGIGIIWASKFIKNKKSKIKNKKLGIASRCFFNIQYSIFNIFWLNVTLAAILFNRKWLASEIPERVTGIDLMWELSNRAQERGWKIFLLGGREGIAEEVAEKLKAIYSRINIVGVYAGNPEEEGIAEYVAKAKPDILFVAYGSPRAEKFIYKNLKKLGAKVVIGVGGSFDFIVGCAKRAPMIFQKLGLEWLWRFFHQPLRVRRIFNAFPRFVWEVWKRG